MNGKLNVAIVLLGYIIAIITIILIIITHKPKTEYDLSISEEPIPLEERIEHDLDVKFEEWIQKAEVEETAEEVVEEIEKPFFTEAEKWLIATVVMSEASTESFKVKQAVAEVVINRVFSDYCEFRYQTAVDEVCLTPLQFARNQEPTKECYEAVEAAIENNDFPDDMLWARKDYVIYGYEYTVEEGSVTKFSTVTDYSDTENAAWD